MKTDKKKVRLKNKNRNYRGHLYLIHFKKIIKLCNCNTPIRLSEILEPSLVYSLSIIWFQLIELQYLITMSLLKS